MNNYKYFRYQVTYPFEGNKIYKSRSISKAINKCYKEYKNVYPDIRDGIFYVTNLDKNIKYKINIKNDQNGGQIDQEANEILQVTGDEEIINAPLEIDIDETNKKIVDLTTDINKTNKELDNVTNILKITDKNILTTTKKLDNVSDVLKITDKNVMETANKLNDLIKINNSEINKIMELEKKTDELSNKIKPEIPKVTNEDLLTNIDVYNFNLKRLENYEKIKNLDTINNSRCTII